MECKKKCADLELEMKQKISEFEGLEDKFKDLVVENLAIKKEVGVLKKKCDELEKSVVENGNADIGKEDVEGKVSKLMAKNKVLECEKRKAESEVEVWKAKYEALELRVRELEGRNKDYNLVGKVKREIGISEVGNKDVSEVGDLRDGSSVLKCSALMQAESTVKDGGDKVHSGAGLITSAHSIEETKKNYVSGDAHSTETPQKHLMHDERAEQSSLPGSGTGTGTVYVGQVRKQLTNEEGSPSKKMAPSTPGGSKCDSLGVIEISESDGEEEVKILNVSTLEKEDNKTVSTEHLVINLNTKECASENKIEEIFEQQSNNEDMIGHKSSSPLNATRKRRRASNIVNSDSEDENILVSEVNVDTQPESVADFQSNSSPLHGTDSENYIHKTTPKRRLMTLRNAASTSKRKVESKIVDNDNASEDDDDDVPISKLVTNVSSVPAAVSENRVPKSLSRRRLASLRKTKENQLQKSSNTKRNRNAMENNCHSEILKEDDGEDASIEENESESEGESMEDFIDDRSDISEKSDSDDSLSIKSDRSNSLSRNSDHGEASGDSENTSGDDLNYGEIMSKLRRKRDSHTSKWEFEAEMLADFGKDPVMCMKAVCALYRQQTSEEQSAKGALYRNQRGFSHCDAYRGTSLAEFLTDGSGGELRKSVEELKQYSAKGIEMCRELAKRYSKQLFAIYENKEDPFFLPNKIRD